MVKEQDLGKTKFGITSFNLKIIQIGKNYTGEKKDKGHDFHFNNCRLCVKGGTYSLLAYNLILTPLIFVKKFFLL